MGQTGVWGLKQVAGRSLAPTDQRTSAPRVKMVASGNTASVVCF